jgi:DNA-binding beta-propeller fold protein YncE
MVTDWANHCIRVLDDNGNFKFKFGELGERPGQFREPYGVAVDDGGRIFVAEKGNNRVQMFDADGEFIRYLVRYKQGDDVFLAPFDVVCLPNMEVAVLCAIKDAVAAEIRIYNYVLDIY